MGGLFGSSPSGPAPFRAPDWQEQFNLAGDIARSQAYQAYFQPQSQGPTWSPYQQQWGQPSGVVPNVRGPVQAQQGDVGATIDYAGSQPQGQNMPLGVVQYGNTYGLGPAGATYIQGRNFGPGYYVDANGNRLDLGTGQFGGTGQQGGGYNGPGSQNYGDLYNVDSSTFRAGQQIPGQLGTTVNPYQFQSQQYNPYQFNYGYNPYQMVGDAFTPQAMRLANMYQTELGRTLGNNAEDYNRRGLYQSGALTEDNRRTQEDLGGQYFNALSGLAGQQANAFTQAGQFGANLEAQRQQQQAEEMFRNVGANNQMAQNLAQLGFNQALSGRQQAVNEQQLGIQSQQNALDQLLRLAGLSAGASPGSPGSKGLFGTIAPVAGAVIGGIAGGPAGASAGYGIGQGVGSLGSYGGFWS